MARVVVVEDSKAVQQQITASLTRGGHTFVCFTTGESALDYIRKNTGNIDIVLLDNVLSGTLSGLETYECLINEGIHVPATMVSSVTSVPIVRKFLTMGGLDFIEKPWVDQQILDLHLVRTIGLAIRSHGSKESWCQSHVSKKIQEHYGSFIAEIAHELRTPVQIISSNIRYLTEDIQKGSTSEVLIDLDEIQKNVDRLARFIEFIVDIGKIDTINYNKTANDVIEHVNYIVSQTQESARSKSISLNVSSSGLTSLITYDRKYIELVLRNILGNAIKYTEKQNTCIEIYIGFSHTGVEVLIHDEGIGIPESETSLVFDKFRRGSNAVRTEGTGIGLFFCKKVIEGHNGHIWLTQNNKGGTTASITLPRSTQ